jgi:hypothetical protein
MSSCASEQSTVSSKLSDNEPALEADFGDEMTASHPQTRQYLVPRIDLNCVNGSIPYACLSYGPDNDCLGKVSSFPSKGCILDLNRITDSP